MRQSAFYDVTFYPKEDIGWDSKSRKWCSYEESKSTWCSHAHFRTAKRARKCAIGLSYRFPEAEIILMQWCTRRGKRAVKEYYIKGRKQNG